MVLIQQPAALIVQAARPGGMHISRDSRRGAARKYEQLHAHVLRYSVRRSMHGCLWGCAVRRMREVTMCTTSVSA